MATGLKRDLVIVNEYTVPTPGKRKNGGHRGSRGGTPGDYVVRYMARELATEPIAPIRRNRTDEFITRYMARESAVERADITHRSQLKKEMKIAQGDGGVAFGYGSPSLSHDRLHGAAKDIQRLFDEGHTVMKTVISFDQDYLKRNGLVPEDFEVNRRGDYRGHVDQMKLRLAVMNGIDRMSRVVYDDLRYVAVIQVDTEHVHCHLAMVDAGPGRVARDGTQKGKLDARSKSLLRRGIDGWLDEKQSVRHLSSAVGYERRNVVAYVKKWAHQQMLRESLPQFLLACLPEDRRKWRASSNDKDMRKPNRLVREIVEELVQSPESGMSTAMAGVHAYADERRRREDLSSVEWQRLVDTGREQIIERGTNAVYALLRQLPDDALKIRTPMLDVMGMDYEQMAAKAHDEDQDDIVGFGFRLRSYASRMQEHVDQREHYRASAAAWRAADEQGDASTDSRALLRHYEAEEEWHARCAAKYRSFLSFAPPVESRLDGWDAVAEHGERLISLESMRRDSSLRRTKDEDEAERLGMAVYGQSGGRLVSRGTPEADALLASRIARMRAEHDRLLDELRVDMAGRGLLLKVTSDPATGRETAEAELGTEFPFSEVKALDLHRMRYDFSQDVEVGPKALASFSAAAARRSSALKGAVQYLVDTGQDAVVDTMPVRDVEAMVSLATRIEADPDSKLSSEVALIAKEQSARRSRATTLSQGLSRSIQRVVPLAIVAQQEELQTPTRDTEEGLE